MIGDTAYINPASVLLNDALNHRESQPYAFAFYFGRKKRSKKFIDIFLGNSDSRICDIDPDSVFQACRSQPSVLEAVTIAGSVSNSSSISPSRQQVGQVCR